MLRTCFKLLPPSATAALLVACSNGGLVSIAPPPPGPPPPPGSGAPAAITEVSGGNQTGLAGAALEQPLVVRVTDNAGGGVANAAVRWESGSGQLTLCFPTETECHTPPVFVNTDAQGLSQIWVHPLALGVGSVGASVTGVPGFPVVFSLEVTGMLVVVQKQNCGEPDESVQIRNPVGQPNVTVPIGTPVVWEFTSTGTCSARLVSSSVPPGGDSFDSQNLTPGGRFTFVPGVAGVWSYQEQLSGATAQITAQ